MALWGDQNQLDNKGTISLNYSTGVVTGSGTSFGLGDGFLAAGDLIRIGGRENSGQYVGDAIVLSVQSPTQLTVVSTEGLSGGSAIGVAYAGYQGPVYTTWDPQYQRRTFVGANPGVDNIVYGIPVGVAQTSDTLATEYKNIDAGYVGIITYNDNLGNLRVKRETLVAGSSVVGAGASFQYPTNNV